MSICEKKMILLQMFCKVGVMFLLFNINLQMKLNCLYSSAVCCVINVIYIKGIWLKKNQ